MAKRPPLKLGKLFILTLWLLASVCACHISTAEGEEPQPAASYFLQSKEKLEENDCYGAIGLLNRAIQADPNFVDAILLRASCRAELEDSKGALRDLSAASRLKDQFTKSDQIYYAFLVKGQVLFEIEDYEGAIVEFESALKVSPLDEIALLYLSEAKTTLESRREIADSEEIKNTGFVNHLEIGRALEHAGNLEGALENYSLEIANCEDLREVLRRGRTEAVIKTCDRNAYKWRAEILTRLGDYDRAADDYSKWIQSSHDEAAKAEGFSLRGLTRLLQGRAEEAEADFAEALQLLPESEALLKLRIQELHKEQETGRL